MAGKTAATKPAESGSEQALAIPDYQGGQLAEGMEDYMAGSSDFSQQDISIPFLKLIQGLSPQIQPADPKYIEEAKQGMILENVTPRVMDGAKGIYVIPALYHRSYTEWKPGRGGFVADHGSDPSCLKAAHRETDSNGKVVMKTDEGNDIAEAALYYVFWAERLAGPWHQALLAMSGTQWRTARDWNTNMQNVVLTKQDGSRVANPLPFAMIYHLTSQAQKKDNFNFYGWKVTPEIYTLAHENGLMLVQGAVDFRKLALEGRVKGVQDEEAPGDEPGTAGGADAF